MRSLALTLLCLPLITLATNHGPHRHHPDDGLVKRLSSPQSGCSQSYTVVKGDTCNAILAKFRNSYSLNDFYAANPAVNNRCTNLQIGQKVCVAGAKPGASPAQSSSKPAAVTPTPSSGSAPAAAPPLISCIYTCPRQDKDWNRLKRGDAAIHGNLLCAYRGGHDNVCTYDKKSGKLLSRGNRSCPKTAHASACVTQRVSSGVVSSASPSSGSLSNQSASSATSSGLPSSGASSLASLATSTSSVASPLASSDTLASRNVLSSSSASASDLPSSAASTPSALPSGSSGLSISSSVSAQPSSTASAQPSASALPAKFRDLICSPDHSINVFTDPGATQVLENIATATDCYALCTETCFVAHFSDVAGGICYLEQPASSAAQGYGCNAAVTFRAFFDSGSVATDTDCFFGAFYYDEHLQCQPCPSGSTTNDAGDGCTSPLSSSISALPSDSLASSGSIASSTASSNGFLSESASSPSSVTPSSVVSSVAPTSSASSAAPSASSCSLANVPPPAYRELDCPADTDLSAFVDPASVFDTYMIQTAEDCNARCVGSCSFTLYRQNDGGQCYTARPAMSNSLSPLYCGSGGVLRAYFTTSTLSTLADCVSGSSYFDDRLKCKSCPTGSITNEAGDGCVDLITCMAVGGQPSSVASSSSIAPSSNLPPSISASGSDLPSSTPSSQPALASDSAGSSVATSLPSSASAITPSDLPSSTVSSAPGATSSVAPAAFRELACPAGDNVPVAVTFATIDGRNKIASSADCYAFCTDTCFAAIFYADVGGGTCFLNHPANTLDSAYVCGSGHTFRAFFTSSSIATTANCFFGTSYYDEHLQCKSCSAGQVTNPTGDGCMPPISSTSSPSSGPSSSVSLVESSASPSPSELSASSFSVADQPSSTQPALLSDASASSTASGDISTVAPSSSAASDLPSASLPSSGSSASLVPTSTVGSDVPSLVASSGASSDALPSDTSFSVVSDGPSAVVPSVGPTNAPSLSATPSPSDSASDQPSSASSTQAALPSDSAASIASDLPSSVASSNVASDQASSTSSVQPAPSSDMPTSSSALPSSIASSTLPPSSAPSSSVLQPSTSATCKTEGQTCTRADQCCSASCIGEGASKACGSVDTSSASSSSSSVLQPSASATCSAGGVSCKKDSECCSDSCSGKSNSKVCDAVTAPSSSSAPPPLPSPSCLADGSASNDPKACCSGANAKDKGQLKCTAISSSASPSSSIAPSASPSSVAPPVTYRDLACPARSSLSLAINSQNKVNNIASAQACYNALSGSYFAAVWDGATCYEYKSANSKQTISCGYNGSSFRAMFNTNCPAGSSYYDNALQCKSCGTNQVTNEDGTGCVSRTSGKGSRRSRHRRAGHLVI